MKTIYALFLFALFFVAVITCQPKKSVTITGGGKGGNVTIKIAPEFYGSFVDTCMVFVKYGTLDAPAGGVYDDSVVCIVSNDTSFATFSNLTVGLYYFFGKGYHEAGGHPPNVKGAQTCTISTDGSYLFYLPTYSYTP